MELEPQHRRGRDAARRRDRDRLAQPARSADSPRGSAISGATRTKIAATAANDSWKPASRSVYGFHARSDERREQQEVPAVALPGGEPRKRAERADDACAHHRRLRADGEDVRRDARERAELRDQPRHAEQPRRGRARRPRRTRRSDPTRPAGGRAPTRGTGRAASARRAWSSPSTTPARTAPRSPDAPPASERSTCARRRRRRRRDRRAVPTRRQRLGPQHDVDALASQPGSLVEAVIAARAAARR